MFDQAALLKIVKRVQEIKPNFTPRFGIILGSGLGPLADEITDATIIAYKDLEGMPVSSVSGHAGQLVLGLLRGVPVACLKGRVHYYEGAQEHHFKILIRLLKSLGCETLLLTNAAGSMRAEVGPGELVLVNDHINFQSRNPLLGENDAEFGDRFFPMDDAYNKTLREQFHACAKELNFTLHEGVYLSVLGPNFETPAEIRMFKQWGADVLGMSTVPEVLVARHCGLKVALISTVTNLAAGMSDEQITHEGTLHYGQLGSTRLRQLIGHFLEHYGSQTVS